MSQSNIPLTPPGGPIHDPFLPLPPPAGRPQLPFWESPWLKVAAIAMTIATIVLLQVFAGWYWTWTGTTALLLWGNIIVFKLKGKEAFLKIYQNRLKRTITYQVLFWLGFPFILYGVGSTAKRWNQKSNPLCVYHLVNADPAKLPEHQRRWLPKTSATDLVVKRVDVGRFMLAASNETGNEANRFVDYDPEELANCKQVALVSFETEIKLTPAPVPKKANKAGEEGSEVPPSVPESSLVIWINRRAPTPEGEDESIQYYYSVGLPVGPNFNLDDLKRGFAWRHTDPVPEDWLNRSFEGFEAPKEKNEQPIIEEGSDLNGRG